MSASPVVIGNATLWLGDSRELVDRFGPVDALIGDPPYGQDYKPSGERTFRIPSRNGGRYTTLRMTKHERIAGDDKPFDPAPWLKVAPTVLIWGAHKFSDRLPPGGWLVWDKLPTGKVRDFQGDGEAAWINHERPLRMFRLLWDGLCVGAAAKHEVTAGQKRVHAAQKPEALMRWCIEQAGTPRRILDPWMGSGSTGVAAMQMGLSFVGCEIHEPHFSEACRRIERAQQQARLSFAEVAA